MQQTHTETRQSLSTVGGFIYEFPPEFGNTEKGAILIVGDIARNDFEMLRWDLVHDAGWSFDKVWTGANDPVAELLKPIGYYIDLYTRAIQYTEDENCRKRQVDILQNFIANYPR